MLPTTGLAPAVNVITGEVTLPGFTTLTLTFPAAPGTTTVADNDVAEATVAGTTAQPKLMAAPSTKFVPVTFKTIVVPARPDVGSSETIVGTGLTTFNGVGDDGPPPGMGFVTTMDAEPKRVEAGSMKVSVDALTNADATGLPFTVTCDAGR